MKNTCCVPHCRSNRGSVMLHRFPKTKIGLQKWVESINCAKLKKFKYEELQSMFVCHKHFEKRFITASSRLKRSAHPTLFSDEEIDAGIPALAHYNNENFNPLIDHDYRQTRKRKHNDHSYCKPLPLKESQEINVSHSNVPPTLLMNENKYTQVQNLLDALPSTSKNFQEIPKDQVQPVMTKTTCPETPKKAFKKPKYINKNLTPRCRQLLTEYKKAKKQLNFAVRAKKALKYSKKGIFEKLTANLKPLAKKILWMQISQSTKQTKGRRFSDDEKMIALAIMKQSPKSYKFLRQIFILPSVRTVNKMISTLKVESGINSHIFHAIKTEVNNWPESKKYCTIIFDEVALEPGLSYDKHSDKICGLVELQNKTNNYADHALVFMVRGAIHKWQQPISFYFCEGATSSYILKNILKEVVTEIIKTGLIPVALVCDQGTAFQSAINKLKEDTRKQQILLNENIDDTIKIDDYNISMIYDPPHLIKGIRNNFLNKNISYNGKTSKWSDIVDVYLTDCKHADIRMLHKLSDEHVLPQKLKKMKVKNCTRVLSKTVASALAYTANFSHYADGKPISDTLLNTSETVSFFDELFDSCNGSALSAKNKGKPLRQAVTRKSMHEEFWKNAIAKLEKIKFIDSNGRECTVPSQKNFIVTLKSLIRLWHLFKEKGFKIMRPRYLNSDPIENFFGQVRAYSFRNNDPNCQSFKNIFRSLLITRFIHFHSDSFNCEDSSGDQIIKLKNLFTENCEDRLILPLSSNDSISISFESHQNVIEEARKERLNVHSRAYTAGWVVRKCLNKYNCVDCKNSLTQNNESAVHKWISQREFKEFKNRSKLTYPSEHAVRYFSYIVKEANEYLESKPMSDNISKRIILNLSKYSFDSLKCGQHKEALLEYFVSITIKLCVINWCSIINKILRGVDIIRLNVGDLPEMQRKALEKYKKKLKNKKLNK